jgi:hypothetical protein
VSPRDTDHATARRFAQHWKENGRPLDDAIHAYHAATIDGPAEAYRVAGHVIFGGVRGAVHVTCPANCRQRGT